MEGDDEVLLAGKIKEINQLIVSSVPLPLPRDDIHGVLRMPLTG